MRISEAKQCIKELYTNTGSVSALISERGVGKTSAYKQCAKELGIGYIGLYAAALEGPDFMGLPDKDREKGITRYLAPQFLPSVEAVEAGIYPENGILVLEELNRVPSDTTSVLYPLLLERKINGHNIADGWKIGVTMNPDSLNYSVNSLDDAMLDRFVSIEITANLEDYMDYSIANNPNDNVLSFLQACPDMLLIVKKSADSTALSKSPTPRGWTKVQEMLNKCSLNEKLMIQLISGVIGPEAASSFYGFLKDRSFKIPSAEVLLNNFEEVKADINEILEKNRLDVISIVIKRLVYSLQLQEIHYCNLNRFLDFVPEEVGILFFKSLAAKRPDDFQEIISHLNSFDSLSDRIIRIMMS
jgi:hypothetical protein